MAWAPEYQKYFTDCIFPVLDHRPTKSTAIGGNSTTTWTEFCHFVDSFYTLCVDKNRHFLTPSPPHLVHLVIECPLKDDCFSKNNGGWPKY